MQKVQEAKTNKQKQIKDDAKFVPVESDVCEVVNELLAHDQKDLTDEQLNLILDCNKGQFKGKNP